MTVLYEKMSKSKHNGLDPLEVVRMHGADMARLMLLFSAQPRSEVDWGRVNGKPM